MKNINEREWLIGFGDTPVLRKLMSSAEIKMANKFVKRGLMSKGTSDDKQATVTYYVNINKLC